MLSRDFPRCLDNTSSQRLSLADDSIPCPESGSCALFTCPVITFSTDSELADVGESFLPAELPTHPDSLSAVQPSSALANHSCDLLTLQWLDVNNNNWMKLRPGGSESDEADGPVTADGDLAEQLTREGTHIRMIR